MKSRFLTALLPFCLLGLALSGCVSHRRIGTQAVTFNLAVEKAQNEMLLLNVIRAKDRLPMYLTSVSRLSGSVTTGVTLGSSAELANPVGNDTYTYGLTPGASYSTNPSFDIAILDTQEFMRGFLSPISKETFAYFWNQGWPREVLLYFLVQRIELVNKACPGQPARVYENYPEGESFEAFGDYVRRFIAQDPHIETRPNPQAIGPLIPAGDAGDLAQLVTVAKEGLVLQEVKDSRGYRMGFQLQRPGTDVLFTLRSPHREDQQEDIPACVPDKPGSSAAGEEAPKPRSESEMGVLAQTDRETTFVLRSPEALLYYLGQIARQENPLDDRARKVPVVCVQDRAQPLFAAYRPTDCAEGVLSVGSGEGRFLIPRGGGAKKECEEGRLDLQKLEPGDKPACDTGRSMQALRLLSQLMALQKSAKELPGTAAVRLIGGP